MRNSGVILLAMGIYSSLQKDTPEGNFKDFKERRKMPAFKKDEVVFP